MTQPRIVGMMINHQEIDHTLTAISDTLRNAAYKVASDKYPVGHAERNEYFEEDGTLKGYDEDSNKALLKDALDHYIQYANHQGDHLRSDFNYYLDDSFQMVSEHINQQPQVMSYLTAQFASACGVLAGALAPVVEDLSNSGQSIDKIESFTVDGEKSYYVVFGEDINNPEAYDPKEDDLSSVVVDDTPEVLAAWEVRKQQIRKDEVYGELSKQYNKVIDTSIENGEAIFPRKKIEPLPLHPHIANPPSFGLTFDIQDLSGLL